MLLFKLRAVAPQNSQRSTLMVDIMLWGITFTAFSLFETLTSAAGCLKALKFGSAHPLIDLMSSSSVLFSCSYLQILICFYYDCGSKQSAAFLIVVLENNLASTNAVL